MVKGYGFRTCMGVTNKVKIESLILGVFRVRFFFCRSGGIVEIKIQGVSGIGNWRHTVIFSLSAILLRSAILVSYCVDMQLHCN